MKQRWGDACVRPNKVTMAAFPGSQTRFCKWGKTHCFIQLQCVPNGLFRAT